MYGGKHDEGEDESLLGASSPESPNMADLKKRAKKQKGQQTKLTDVFIDRKKLRNQRGFDETDRDIGSFLKVAKSLRDEHSAKLKLGKELSHDIQFNQKSNRLALLAVLSVIVYVIHMEVNFNIEHRHMDNEGKGSLGFRFLLSAITGLLLCALFDYHQLTVYVFEKYQMGVGDEGTRGRWWPREHLMQFMGEALICLVHPLPGLITNKLGCFLFLRLYLLMMLVRNYSEIYTKRGMVYESGHLKRGGKRIDLELVLKIYVDAQPFLCLCVVFSSLWLAMSYGVYICEREGINGAELTYMKCVWNTAFLVLRGVSRMDSSGSTAGRAIELTAAVVGVIGLAVVVALVTELMEVSEAEEFAATWMHRQKMQTKSEQYAAELIQAAWRLHQLQVNDPNEVTLEVEFFFKSLLERHKMLRDERKAEETLSLDIAHDKILSISRDVVGVVDDIEDIKVAQDELLATFDVLDDYMVAEAEI